MYSYFPYIALQLGGSLTTFSITAASLAGMYKLNESNVVNSIEFVKEGEHAGKLKINVSTSFLLSKNIIADVS